MIYTNTSTIRKQNNDIFKNIDLHNNKTLPHRVLSIALPPQNQAKLFECLPVSHRHKAVCCYTCRVSAVSHVTAVTFTDIIITDNVNSTERII